jgi:hypothetical protein
VVTASFPDPSDYDLPGRQPWDRRHAEPSRAYAAFRYFRDLRPTQRSIEAVASEASLSARRCRVLAARWEWRERADAWDDACHRVEDQERLEAIRQMHSTHRRAGRAAVAKAIQGLAKINAEEMSPVHVARLLELGAKLERSTLLTSVEELQGLDEYEDEESEDPWDRIARELDPANAIPDL